MKRKEPDNIGSVKNLRRSVVRGLMKLMILQYAAHAPLYGGAVSKALRKFGYITSPGTLYPLLHTLEEARLLRSSTTLVHGRVRRYYKLTAAGKLCLAETRAAVIPLLQEILAAEKGEKTHTEPQEPCSAPFSLPQKIFFLTALES